MNRKLKSLLQSLATATLIAALTTGCMSSNNKPNNNSPSDDGNSFTETLSFSVTLPSHGVDNTQSMIHKEWLKVMEQKMGMNLDIKWNYIPASDYDSKLQLEIASNNLTDVFMTPLFYDVGELSRNGQIVELSQYRDSMPNYLNYLSQVDDGEAKVTNGDGKMFYFQETSTPRFPEDQGMSVQNVASYRYDLFEQHNIKIPDTLDELYEAALKLKELYPDKYPINTRWNDLRSLFAAHHVQDDVFWNGNEYVYGILEPGYREALEYANKLYAAGLLDPEYLLDTDDLLRQKALNDSNFIWLAQWFTEPANYTRTADDGKIFVASLYPSNPDYGTSWQQVANANTPDLGWSVFAVSSRANDPENIIKFLDMQYDPEVDRLITWGLEGVTYELDEEGNPTFMEEFKTADDPWVVGDKYGIRASKSHRPGMQLSADAAAFVDFAAMDYTYIDGKYEEVPLEKHGYLRGLPMPDNEYIPSWLFAPTFQFTQDEGQLISEIMTPIKTYVEEQQSRFVFGRDSFDNWSTFIDTIQGMGDIEEVLRIHNEAAQRSMSN